MSERLQEFGAHRVGDNIWFILKDGLVREGMIMAFIPSEGRDTAVDVFDTTDKRHRFLRLEHLLKTMPADTKMKRRRKVATKRKRGTSVT